MNKKSGCLSGHISVGRVQASQAWCRGFEPRCPLHSAFLFWSGEAWRPFWGWQLSLWDELLLLQIADFALVFHIPSRILCKKALKFTVCSLEAGLKARFFIIQILCVFCRVWTSFIKSEPVDRKSNALNNKAALYSGERHFGLDKQAFVNWLWLSNGKMLCQCR